MHKLWNSDTTKGITKIIYASINKKLNKCIYENLCADENNKKHFLNILSGLGNLLSFLGDEQI